jgi:hypothetical protein
VNAKRCGRHPDLALRPTVEPTYLQTMPDTLSPELPDRVTNVALRGPAGQEVVKIESVDIVAGQTITLEFEHVAPRWRQGVFLATVGTLRVGRTGSPSLVVWSDSSPKVLRIDVEETRGRLILYNVWDSGRGRRWESQSATSGMVVDQLADGSRRYSCTDIGFEPDFGRLVFRLSFA